MLVVSRISAVALSIAGSTSPEPAIALVVRLVLLYTVPGV